MPGRDAAPAATSPPPARCAPRLVRPPFLRPANDTPWPRIKRVPDRPQHLVDVGHAVRFAPPRRIPRNPVMLVDHQIKTRLLPIPTDSLENRRALATTTDDFDSFKGLFAFCAGEIIGKPICLMAAFHQRLEIRQRHPLRAAGKRIARVTPVQHQEAHGSRKATAAKSFRAATSWTCRAQRGREQFFRPPTRRHGARPDSRFPKCNRRL